MDSEEDILDTSYLNLEGDFDTQVHNILSFVRLTVDKVRELRRLFNDLENALQEVAPGCHVQPFGSVVTGLGIKTSDVDCYVEVPFSTESSVKHVIQARNILKRYYKTFTKVFAITAAKVPIVKFLHIPTNRMCDVNFKSPAGVQNSHLIGFLLQLDRRALNLAILIKYWSKVHKFTGTNLLANYALILMVIFYLQLRHILPAICALQNNVPSYMIDNWNTAFDDTVQGETRNSESLYELMGGFFKFYSAFNYKENVISPFVGKTISRKCLVRLSDVPREFNLYIELVSRGVCKKIRLDSYICVQDPFEHNRNCTVAVFNKLAEKIITYFKFAAQKFEEERDVNFLNAIFLHSPPIPHPSSTAERTNEKHVFQNKITKRNPQPLRKGVKNGFNMWFTQMNRRERNKAYNNQHPQS